MSQIDKDAAKRAAAGESLGAFVTFDINRLEKDELIMLGMREMLAKYLAIATRGFQNAMDSGSPPLMRALGELRGILQADSDRITEELTRGALRRKTASIQEIPKVKT